MTQCLLGLGSNLGDRHEFLQSAINTIARLKETRLLKSSSFYESEPVGGPKNQLTYLNAACLIETNFSPLKLLEELAQIEQQHHRQRAKVNAPRTLDIDILLYSNQIVQAEKLTIPHRQIEFRPFVLKPAAEICPMMIHPILETTIDELHKRLTQQKLSTILLIGENHLFLEQLSNRLYQNFPKIFLRHLQCNSKTEIKQQLNQHSAQLLIFFSHSKDHFENESHQLKQILDIPILILYENNLEEAIVRCKTTIDAINAKTERILDKEQIFYV